MVDRERVVSASLGLAGAVAGGAIGYFVFMWMARQGFYAMILPGALLGLGCGLASRRRSAVLGIACGATGKQVMIEKGMVSAVPLLRAKNLL